MFEKATQTPPPDTAAGMLLTLIALSGEFPTALVSRLPGGEAYKTKVIKRLKKNGLLRTYYADGLRGFRLTAVAKKLLLKRWPDYFDAWLTGYTETNTLKSEPLRRLRLHRMAEVLAAMYNAGVAVCPWEKPALFSPTPPAAGTQVEWPVYYNSREVKEIGPQRDKIRGSRATGVLLTRNDILAVYNTGDSVMKWERNSERRLEALLEMDIGRYRLPGQYAGVQPGAIVFGAAMKMMPALMGIGGGPRHSGQRHSNFITEDYYNHFYYLTNSPRGEFVLQLLCRPEKKAVLDGILIQGLSEPRSNWYAEHDALDGDAPVLFGYTCDMPRIRRFVAALQIHGIKGWLYCFDFQRDTLRQIGGPNMELRCMDFEKVERIL